MNAAVRTWLVVLVIALAATRARADTHRIAIVIGNNLGDPANPALHYAEEDAAKLSQTLLELGGVESPDLYLLQGRSLAAVQSAVAATTRKVATWHSGGGSRVVLLFYFSGHSDGEVLELGGERLGFTELRQWLTATGADVRVVIIDSCKSGALLAVKGGRPGAGFQIRLSDNVATSGEALLTSSAANEVALESREIRGSFFTHHLVSALRGAADVSADGRVTLSEAYQYAFAHTVAATSATIFGPQHPAYDYRLAGEGDLVLTTMSHPDAALEIPPGFDRVLVIQVARDVVLAEIPRGAARRVAVPPGTYQLRAWRDGRTFAGRVDVTGRETRIVRGGELAPTELAATATKGDAAPSPHAAIDLMLAAGGQGGTGSPIGALPSLFAAARSSRPSGWSVGLDVASARGSGYRETSATVLGGYFIGAYRGPFRAELGLHVGAGIIAQHRSSGGVLTSPTVMAAPWLDLSMALGARVSIAIEGGLSTTWLRRDGRNAIALVPSGFVGLLFHF